MSSKLSKLHDVIAVMDVSSRRTGDRDDIFWAFFLFSVYKVFRLPQNINGEEVKDREIRCLPDLSIVNFLSVYGLVEIFLNYYPYYPTHRLYFGEVETPYTQYDLWLGS